jgi:pyruvate/2-oxoacid:ferredoxin oxidoreductase alpha subunit
MSNETIAYHIEPDYGIEMNPRAIKNISSQKLIHNTDALTIHGNFAGEKSYSNASHLLSLVSYSLSDISFVYPAFTNNFIGHESLLKCQPDSRLNVKGHTTKVVKMLTNTNAGAIAEGASSTGLESSVLMSSTSLPHFLATIHRLTKLRKPMVFHIGLQTATSTLQLINDSADIYKTAQVSPESIIITSGTLQETHDVAILAYMLNFTDVEEKQSVLHFFDGVLEEDSVVRQCSLADLKAISNQVSQFSSSSTVSLSSNISGKTVTNFHRLEHAFETFSKCVGRSYAPFMFSGSTNAKVMIVSLASSPAACAISQVVSEYNRKNPKDCASYLKVVVYRPWNTEAFLKIVPESVRDIIVIDSVTLSFHSLREDIQASFYTQGAKSRVNVHDSVFSNYEPSDHSGSISVSALSKFFGTFMQPAVGVMWPGARTTSKSLNFFLENHKAEFGPVDDLSYTYWVVESYPREGFLF